MAAPRADDPCADDPCADEPCADERCVDGRCADERSTDDRSADDAILDALAAQVRAPSGWEVVRRARLDAGWLGGLACDLALLAPGTGGLAAHRAQLVVMVGDGVEDGACTGPVHARALAVRLAAAAAADVPEAWHVDAAAGWTTVYRAPFHGRYRSRTLAYPGETVVPLALTRCRVVPLRARCAR